MATDQQHAGDQGDGNGPKQQLANEAYTVGWICAISTEYVAARVFLDDEHESPEHTAQHDNNSYTLGSMGKHNVVIAVLPDGEYGTASAATVARDMLHSFPNVRIGLMVGIGGGAPNETNDIRLGDIAVSAPRDGRGGVFQYDYGKTVQDQTFRETGFLAQPPTVLRTAVSAIKAHYESDGHQIQEAINTVLQTKRKLQKKYRQPDVSTDRLFRTDVKHPVDNDASCVTSCGADASAWVLRQARDEYDDNPMVHYGLIASANQLMKDAVVRDKLAREKNVLCFEMEAAGLMNHFPCLVIRGICDYADTHKNKEWQGYAAMTAAAYAKDILNQIAPNKVEAEKRLSEKLAAINESLRVVYTETLHIREGVNGLESDGRLHKIRAWLSPPDPSTNFNKAREQHHQGTGQWLLESDQYKKWKTQRNSFLWLNGISGCGKTILSSSVVADLEQGATLQSLVYFYFDFNDVKKQSVENAIRSLVTQLYYKREDLRIEVNSLYSSHDYGGRQLGSALLFKLFQNMVHQAGEVWIVLDALDECHGWDDGSKNGLLSWIQSLRDASLNIHILTTSQPRQDIQSRIERWACVEIITLDNDRIWGDINSYIKARTKQMGRWENLPKVRKEIEDTLVAKADGMFRWVSCQFNTLENCFDWPSVRRELVALPHDLETTYLRILQRIPTKHLDYTKRLLQFMTYSERPLRLEEAVDVIAVNPSSQPHFNPVNRMPVHEEVVRYCSSLAILVRREKIDGTSITEIQLAHSSVQKYLMSDQLEPKLALALEIVNAKAAIVGVELSRQEVAPIVKDYLSSQEAFSLGYRLYKPDRAWKGGWKVEKDDVSPLYYASLNGLCRSVHMLICDGANLNAQGGYYGNALQAASSRGHEEIVKILLANGAELNTQGGVHGNALRAASSKGHRNIVWLLLVYGADINQRTRLAGSALYAASSRGHASVVHLLLENKANVNINGGYFGNALQAASSQGHMEVTSMLHKYKAEGGLHSEAFNVASCKGQSAAAELLEQNETIFNIREDEEGHAVCSDSSDYESIVQQLLEKDVNVNAKGGYYGTALQAASVRRNHNIVKLLLNRGANVNARSGVHFNALHGGANIYGTDESSKSPLYTDYFEGYGWVDDLLGQPSYFGTTAKFSDESRQTPLHLASTSGQLKTVKLLLEKGADLNAQAYCLSDGGTPLHMASSSGQLEVVKLLLEKGANVNTIDGYGMTPLHRVAWKGQLEVANLLIEKGADINAVDLSGLTPLNRASITRYESSDVTSSYKGREEVATILIKKGANLNAGRTPSPSDAGILRAVLTSVDVNARRCKITFANSVEGPVKLLSKQLGIRLDVLVLNSNYTSLIELKIMFNSPTDDCEWAGAFAIKMQGKYQAAHYFMPRLHEALPQDSAEAFVVVRPIVAAITRGNIAMFRYCISKMAQAQKRIVEHLGCYAASRGRRIGDRCAKCAGEISSCQFGLAWSSPFALRSLYTFYLRPGQ
ncbi:hypothetical protein PG984_012076 [Apiospora sp. TS-2023a]